MTESAGKGFFFWLNFWNKINANSNTRILIPSFMKLNHFCGWFERWENKREKVDRNSNHLRVEILLEFENSQLIFTDINKSSNIYSVYVCVCVGCIACFEPTELSAKPSVQHIQFTNNPYNGEKWRENCYRYIHLCSIWWRQSANCVAWFFFVSDA